MIRKKKICVARQSLTEKILLHLSYCADFGFSYKFKRGMGFSQFPGKVLRDLIKKDGKGFKDGITNLNKEKFIEKKRSYDGSIIISLTEKGMARALKLRFKKLSSKKEKWDGKWRMVAFDIPNEFGRGRNALRYRLKLAGFYELQKSLFLYPYDCQKEINDFIELFKLQKYVRFALLDFIDNEKDIKRKMRVERS